jgi:hypothetical protein
MMLARIAPGPSGFDIRTFECGKCDHVHTATVDIDPMKSKLIGGWLMGELSVSVGASGFRHAWDERAARLGADHVARALAIARGKSSEGR